MYNAHQPPKNPTTIEIAREVEALRQKDRLEVGEKEAIFKYVDLLRGALPAPFETTKNDLDEAHWITGDWKLHVGRVVEVPFRLLSIAGVQVRPAVPVAVVPIDLSVQLIAHRDEQLLEHWKIKVAMSAPRMSKVAAENIRISAEQLEPIRERWIEENKPFIVLEGADRFDPRLIAQAADIDIADRTDVYNANQQGKAFFERCQPMLLIAWFQNEQRRARAHRRHIRGEIVDVGHDEHAPASALAQTLRDCVERVASHKGMTLREMIEKFVRLEALHAERDGTPDERNGSPR